MKITRKSTRLFALLLCGLLAASCGSGTATTDTTAADTTTAAPETELTDGLPDTDMEGFELKILHFDGTWLSWAETVMDAESENGDILNDSIYRRNANIAERFNCEITVDGIQSINAAYMQQEVMAGDANYDVYFNYDIWITGAIQYLLPWEELPYVNLEAEWWNPGATSVFQIGGKTYSAAGNYSLSVLSRAAGYLFNKTMLEEIQGGDIYQLVRDGKWTLDKMFGMAKLAYTDIDGDSQMGDKDRYGITGSWKEFMTRILLGADVRYINKDKEGYPAFTLPTDEFTINKMLKISDYVMDMEAYHAEATTNIDSLGGKGDFKNGLALFSMGNPFMLEGYRDSDLDIGFVPCPKYDEEQKEYRSPSFGAEVSVLPITLPEDRMENVGMLLEALNFASDQDVVPTYKEVVLKTKSARDDDSADMIDILFDTVCFDFGINAWQDQVTRPLINGIYSNRSGNVASTLAGMQSSVDEQIKKLVEAVKGE